MRLGSSTCSSGTTQSMRSTSLACSTRPLPALSSRQAVWSAMVCLFAWLHCAEQNATCNEHLCGCHQHRGCLQLARSFCRKQVDIGSAAGTQVPWLERPRVLQRSEGFRKTYDEQQAALMGRGDVGAEGYHRRPGAHLLEDLKTKDVQRASVWEVGSLPARCRQHACGQPLAGKHHKVSPCLGARL